VAKNHHLPKDHFTFDFISVDQAGPWGFSARTGVYGLSMGRFM